MTQDFKVTLSQQRLIYRESVKECLMQFYETDPANATKLVADWWRTLRSIEAFRSGLFLHAEAINTAADLAQAEVIELKSGTAELYQDLLRRSRNKILQGKLPVSSAPRASQAAREDGVANQATKRPAFA